MTTTGDGNRVRYGTINTALVSRWLKLDLADDGPFWALNLMKYRERADYGEGNGPPISGREADDAYTPREPLAAIGAQIVFAADVERTLAGDGVEWDRVGIVRYPSRRAFFEMQQRDDFKQKHVHKDAGMEFTIVMSCLPVLPFAGSAERAPYVELTVVSDADAAPRDGGVFDVEGVIVGDERTWARAAFRWLDAPPDGPPVVSAAGVYRLLLRPSIDRLTRSVLDG